MNWNNLNKIETLNEINELSLTKKVLIFKHSTRCGISRMVLKQFESEFDLEENYECYLLDLLNFRTISNEIESIYGITHQSPQLLIIKDKIAIFSATHNEIEAEILKDFE